ncbi:MAG: NAD-dependent epimerase/dehydratase family protein [Burkholderiales bacterium]
MTNAVLVTGAFGYLGGRIAASLTKVANYRLFLGSRTPPIDPPAWLPSGKPVQLDLENAESLCAACARVTHIIHLAATNEIDSEADPERALLTNGLGTLKLLRAAERAGVKRFIYFSTAHVYGSPLSGNITENTLPRPVHPYAITHRAAEDFVLAARRRKTIEGAVIRLSNGLGYPIQPQVDRWTLVGNDLCRQAILQKKLTLRSSGLQKRDFIALSDVARAALHMLELPESELGNGLFNLGGQCSMRIVDLAERIKYRCSVVLHYSPAIVRPAAAADETSPDLDYRIDKLRATGFALQGDLNHEIDGTLALCRQVFQKEPS